ncbi:hypothetical protein [Microseira wollei]|uniref:hypothetical protein n=1 Tax=Microseira wollei TaxID=467598 RepID=UPI001CFF4531|nr:hypothetical protein [Microseira wollei]
MLRASATRSIASKSSILSYQEEHEEPDYEAIAYCRAQGEGTRLMSDIMSLGIGSVWMANC